MSLITGITTFLKRTTVVYSFRTQTRLFTEESGKQEEALEEVTEITETTNTPNKSSSPTRPYDPKFLVRNSVRLHNNSFKFPTSSMVHLLGRVLTNVRTMELTRGKSVEAYNCFFLLTGHAYPDGTGFTQKHR